MVRELKHKLRPENAYLKAEEFEFVLSAPKEELNQFLSCLPQCMKLRRLSIVALLANIFTKRRREAQVIARAGNNV